jgi:hypothetical protein
MTVYISLRIHTLYGNKDVHTKYQLAVISAVCPYVSTYGMHTVHCMFTAATPSPSRG